MDLSSLIAGDFPTVFNPDFQRPSTPPEFDQVRLASLSGDLAAVRDAVERLDQKSYNPELRRRLHAGLYAAIENEHISIVSYLLSQDVKIMDMDFETATKIKSYPILQLLLDHGWDINQPMGWDEPPALQYAVENKDLTIWFLNHSARPDAEGSVLDITPLSIAIMRASFEIIKLLFDRGGSLQHGQLLHYVIYRKKSDYLEVLDFLLDHGAPVNNIMYQNHVEMYLMRMAFGLGTPLHKAAELGRLDIVKHLIEKGADPLIPDARRQTALELAESNGYDQVVEYLRAFSSPPSALPRHDFTDAPGFHI